MVYYEDGETLEHEQRSCEHPICGSVPGHVGWSSEHFSLVEGVHPQGKWVGIMLSLRSLQPKPFYVSMILYYKKKKKGKNPGKTLISNRVR